MRLSHDVADGGRAGPRRRSISAATLPARTAFAFEVPRGGRLRVNTHGSQVVDTWAVTTGSSRRQLSMAHTRAILGPVTVRAGDQLFDDTRQPILLIEEDTSPGVNDTLVAACDLGRYRQLGHEGYHDNCSDNFRNALDGPELVPAPLNLFMNVPVAADGSISFRPPVSRPCDSMLFQALTDLVIVVSACPQDIETQKYGPDTPHADTRP